MARSQITRREALVASGLALAACGAPAIASAQTRTAEEQANLTVIDGFIAAFNARDAEKIGSFLAANARFSAGPIGVFGALQPPMPGFTAFLTRTKSVRMTVKPGSQQARGPMVTHERVDEMVLQDGTTGGSGTWFAVFGLKNGKIVDFIDFQIA